MAKKEPMPTLLVTGANRGLGLALARLYADAGWTVHATARDPAAATELLAVPGAVEVHRLDIADPSQVAALAGALDGVAIDLLVNNAGINMTERSELGDLDYDGWQRDFAVNAVAPIRLSAALADNVAASEGRTIAFMSSRAGSITSNIAGGRYRYRSTKAALNAAVRSLALDLLRRGVTCVAVHPGWARTDMGGPRATISPTESATWLKALFDRLEPHHTGHFLNYDGTELPW
jgi:NAD(P)-dependent dehydrogenase (short-subunit alcohol dehydrogenase family)